MSRTTDPAGPPPDEFPDSDGILAHPSFSDIAPPFDPPPDDTAAAHHRSDIGYADMIVAHFDGQIRYCHEESCWLLFDSDTGWLRDTGASIMEPVIEFARGLYAKALQSPSGDPASTIKAIKEAAELGNNRRITPALEMAKCHPRVSTHSADLDADPFQLGCQNGVVDLHSGSFLPHRLDSLVTRRVACSFDPGATCPIWTAFLERVQPDHEMRAFLKRLFGYWLTGATPDHILPFNYGVGANGKGTSLEQVWLRLMGSYGLKVSNSLVYTSERGQIPHLELACLAGTRFALGEENAQGGRLNESLLKSITGGDRQKGRFHYGNFFDYFPTYKIALVGNHKPLIDGVDEGMWRRFILIVWPVLIPEPERDPQLAEKLQAEFPGILNWAIEGCREWAANGLKPPQSCRETTAAFRSDSDRLSEFTADLFVEDPSKDISAAEVFKAYRIWCEEEGVNRPMAKKTLTMHLVNRGWIPGASRSPSRERVWVGRRRSFALL